MSVEARATVNANAKVNLTLAVGPLRQDGYHRVVSVLQALELHDRLVVEVGAAADVDVQVTAPALPGGDTLCTRAARGWCEAVGEALQVRIEIDKHIPAGAGFGGGSSDAAATLRALNELAVELDIEPLAREHLIALGSAVGSDVPFFLGTTGSAVASGRGEDVLDIPPLAAREFLLLWPGATQPTAAVYAAYEHRRDFMPPTIGAVESARNGHWYNDLSGTALALCEPMRRLHGVLRGAGAEPFVAGSGSGLAILLDDAAPGPDDLVAAATAEMPDVWAVRTSTLH